jgi:hypothetical protein
MQKAEYKRTLYSNLRKKENYVSIYGCADSCRKKHGEEAKICKWKWTKGMNVDAFA